MASYFKDSAFVDVPENRSLIEMSRSNLNAIDHKLLEARSVELNGDR